MIGGASTATPSCVVIGTFNGRGNIGTSILQDYGGAAVKVAIFGSSFLATLFRASIYRTIDYMELPVRNLGDLRKSDTIAHLSLAGQEFYASTMAKMLIDERFLPIE